MHLAFVRKTLPSSKARSPTPSSQKGAAPKVHKHLDAYKDLTEKLIKNFDMHEEDMGSGSGQG
jgi:hypothetical protein